MNELPYSLFLFVAVAVLLAACTAPKPEYTNYYTGVHGMSIDFTTAAPPDEVYEGSANIPVTLTLKNDGPIDVPLGSGALLSYSADPFYFTIPPGNEIQLGQKQPGQTSPTTMIWGKSVYYPDGDQQVWEYLLMKSAKIQGTRQIPESSVFVNLCYPYATILDSPLCIDISSVYPSERPQACQGKTLTFDGQGSPVAITKVEPEMQPFGENRVRPVFKITIDNLGQGTLLAPSDPANVASACLFKTKMADRSQWNTVKVSASLIGDPLACSPDTVTLVNNEGFTRCTYLDPMKYVGSQTNYMTQLHVNLTYTYLQGISKKITIVRLPDANTILPSDLQGFDTQAGCEKLSTNLWNGTACVPKCDYCANHVSDHDPRCTLTSSNSRYFDQPGFGVNESFTCCAIPQIDCLSKEKIGKCFFGLCSNGYCCSS